MMIYFITDAKSEDPLDDYIEIRSHALPQMAISLPRPLFTRIKEQGERRLMLEYDEEEGIIWVSPMLASKIVTRESDDIVVTIDDRDCDECEVREGQCLPTIPYI